MKNYLLLSSFIFFSLFVKAQNLVPNPSFEDTVQCPIFFYDNFATDWYTCGISPDYYNPCANGASVFGAPTNWFGYQNAYDGVAYIGLFTYYPNQREYVITQLAQTLTIGTKYYVSAYISRADTEICASDKFGFKFSTVQYDAGNWAPTNNISQVYTNTIINDSANWVQVFGSFVADSSYQYMVLGNFFDDLNTDTLNCGYSLAIAYYYVDMICVSTDSATCDIGNNISNESSLPIISVYPNPSTDFVNIDFSQFVNPYDIIIYNSLGQTVFSKQKINSSRSTINTTGFGDGVLFIKILYGNQFFYYKLLKQ